jgi:serine/threonine-protein kinase RsbW
MEIVAQQCESPPGAGPPWKRVDVRTTAEIHGFMARVLSDMAQAGFSDRDQFAVRLALGEALVNAIKHGNGGDPAKSVRVSYSIKPGEIAAEIEDQGAGFNPTSVPSPIAPENVERPGGRGVFLMRHYMTFVKYNDRGNRVLLTKRCQK